MINSVLQVKASIEASPTESVETNSKKREYSQGDDDGGYCQWSLQEWTEKD